MKALRSLRRLYTAPTLSRDASALRNVFIPLVAAVMVARLSGVPVPAFGPADLLWTSLLLYVVRQRDSARHRYAALHGKVLNANRRSDRPNEAEGGGLS